MQSRRPPGFTKGLLSSILRKRDYFGSLARAMKSAVGPSRSGEGKGERMGGGADGERSIFSFSSYFPRRSAAPSSRWLSFYFGLRCAAVPAPPPVRPTPPRRAPPFRRSRTFALRFASSRSTLFQLRPQITQSSDYNSGYT